MARKCVRLLVGLVIKAKGKGYREKHHLDPVQGEQREDRPRRQNKTFLTGKSLVVYGLVGLFFLGMFVVIVTGGGQMVAIWSNHQSVPPDLYGVHEGPNYAGFEAANVPTTHCREE